MRILLISNKAPFPPNDGSSIAVAMMANGLYNNGMQVDLLCINTRKHFKDDKMVEPELVRRHHYKTVYRNTNPSVMGAFVNLVTGRSYFASRFYFRAFGSELKKTLIGNSYDIVQLEGIFMASYIPLIRQYSSSKVVLRAHNVEHLIWQRHIAHEDRALMRWYLKLQNKRLKKLEVDCLQHIDALVPITDADRDEFVRLGYKGPVHTCLTGFDFQKTTNMTPSVQRPVSVFYIGSMDWLPNQEAVQWFLANCWQNIATRVPGAKFYVGGKGMPLHFFHRQRPDVVFEEYVENSAQFFQAHTVMVVPLLSGSGLRIKIIEGMSHGKAIVSTSVGAEGIHATSGRNIIIADDPKEFADAVVRLLHDQQHRESVATAAKQFALSEFDNNTVIKNLVRFYQTLINA